MTGWTNKITNRCTVEGAVQKNKPDREILVKKVRHCSQFFFFVKEGPF